MSNAVCVTWRIACPGLRPSSLLPSSPATNVLRSACHDLRISCPWRPYSLSRRSFSGLTPHSPTQSSIFGSKFFPVTVSPRSFQTSGPLQAKSTPAPTPVEHGVPPRARPFSAAEIKAVFGSRKISPELGNRILAVLQGRRIAGTMDLDLPNDITVSVRQSGIDSALEWLRAKYPLDEEAAILARIEREELEDETLLARQAEEQGLYKPQSGSYGAELGEGNDPSGKSILKEIRERNETRILKQEEEKRQKWLAGEEEHREKLMQQAQQAVSLQKFDESAALEARPRADPSERPLLAYMQKKHLNAMSTDMSGLDMHPARRILPSLVTTLIILGLCYAYAVNYEAPARADRLWPDTPPAAATAMALIGVNVGIYLLWKMPPFWRLLNRYFVSVPLQPRPASLVGSIFSHQQLKHLVMNMMGVWFIGTQLHDEIGRGNYLALYMASGVFSSLTSLIARVATGQILVASIGSSGAVFGIIAAWCSLHANDRLTIAFLPAEWKEYVSASGSQFLVGLVALEVFSMVSPWKIVGALDYWAHLGGLFFGALWAMEWKKEREKKRREEMSWVEKLFSDK